MKNNNRKYEINKNSEYTWALLSYYNKFLSVIQNIPDVLARILNYLRKGRKIRRSTAIVAESNWAQEVMPRSITTMAHHDFRVNLIPTGSARIPPASSLCNGC